MKYMRRMILVLILLMTFSIKVSAQTYNLVMKTLSKESSVVMGVEHEKKYVEMRFDGVTTKQQINYIGANPSVNKNISLVALDNYTTFDFNRGTLPGQIHNSQYRYPNAKIVAAVNGDFFDINSNIGQSAATRGPHVRDGKVIFEGYYGPSSSVSVGVKTDGTAFIEVPSYDPGYYIQVLDEEGSVKLKDLPVKINMLPNENELAALLPSFNALAPIEGRKVIIQTHETIIHRNPKGTAELGKYFIEGKISETTDVALESVTENTMVLLGDDFFLDGLINETDIVRLQRRPSGAFKDVYQAISGPVLLLNNGEIIPQTNKDRHPRTAAGLKEDGTIFFITVDGRKKGTYDGVTYEELAAILKDYGAYKGVNLDGGGSTTAILYDEAEKTYVVHNEPSDGNLRQDGNGIGFIYGDIYFPLPAIPYPDNREELSPVTNVLFDGTKLKFNPVPNATSYVAMVAGKKFKSTEPEIILNVESGTYDVSIKAYGDHINYRQSQAAIYELDVYSTTLSELIDYLINYGSNIHNYQNNDQQ